MKVKKEKGIIGTDIVSGIIIFIISSALVVNFYYQIYVTSAEIKIHQVAIRMYNGDI